MNKGIQQRIKDLTMYYFKKAYLPATDFLFFIFSIWLSFQLFFNGNVPQKYASNGLINTLVVSILIMGVYYFLGMYKQLWYYAGIDEFFWLIVTCIVSTTIAYIYTWIFHIDVPFGVFWELFSFITLLTVVNRASLRIFRRINLILQSLLEGSSKRVMIVGGGEAGAIVIKELKNHPELGLNPVAVIDDDEAKHGSKIVGIMICGNRWDISFIAKEKNIDEIIIAIPTISRKDLKDILNECKKTKCRLKILPGLTELINETVTINHIRDVQIEDLLGRDSIELDLNTISGYLSGKTVLVTGGGGSIGSELCRQIALFHPKKLLILDFYENNAYELEHELRRGFRDLEFETIIASIRDDRRIDDIFRKYQPEVVFHAAAHKHVPLMEHNPGEAIKNNIFGTLNVARAANRYRAERFVLISTDKAVNPTNVMGATKRVAEMIIQAMNNKGQTEFVAVRFGNVLGSHGSVIPIFKKQIMEGGPITVTHPEITRYFMTIPEAVQLVIQAGAMARGGEIFILDMGQQIKILDLARDLIRLSGLEPDVDIKIVFTGLREGEKMQEELFLNEEGVTATEHQKIFVCKPLEVDFNILIQEIENFKKDLACSEQEVLNILQRLVPEYVHTLLPPEIV